MAELAFRGRGSDRGQLILVTGFAIAFALVALVLLLNTAIYTENLASRGIDRSPEQAVDFRASVDESLSELVVISNQDDGYNPDPFDNSVLNLSSALQRKFAQQGTIARLNVSTLSVTEGTLIRQTNNTRRFTNVTGSPVGWQLASDVKATRRVRLNISVADLNQTKSDAFYINVSESGSDFWLAYVYYDGSTLFVATEDENGARVTCSESVSTSYAVVDLTAGTVAGADCVSLDWAGGVTAPYNVSFQRPTRAVGTYSFTAKPAGVENTTNLASTTSDNPHAISGIYAVNVTLEYRSANLYYETTVRVAPGEEDDD